MRPIRSALKIVNHSAPSGPTAICPGLKPISWSETLPLVVILPMVLSPALVNHSAPSGPETIDRGSLMPLPVYELMVPLVVIRPMVLSPELVNHSAPSGPVVIEVGLLTLGAL